MVRCSEVSYVRVDAFIIRRPGRLGFRQAHLLAALFGFIMTGYSWSAGSRSPVDRAVKLASNAAAR